MALDVVLDDFILIVDSDLKIACSELFVFDDWCSEGLERDGGFSRTSKHVECVTRRQVPFLFAG